MPEPIDNDLVKSVRQFLFAGGDGRDIDTLDDAYFEDVLRRSGE